MEPSRNDFESCARDFLALDLPSIERALAAANLRAHDWQELPSFEHALLFRGAGHAIESLGHHLRMTSQRESYRAQAESELAGSALRCAAYRRLRLEYALELDVARHMFGRPPGSDCLESARTRSTATMLMDAYLRQGSDHDWVLNATRALTSAYVARTPYRPLIRHWLETALPAKGVRRA